MVIAIRAHCVANFSVSPPPRQSDYLKDFGNAEQWDAGTQRCTRIGSAIDQGASWLQRTVGEEEMIRNILSALIGSFVGTWVTYQLGYSNSNGGREIIGIIIAIVVIAIYVGITGRTSTAVVNCWAGSAGTRRRRSRR